MAEERRKVAEKKRKEEEEKQEELFQQHAERAERERVDEKVYFVLILESKNIWKVDLYYLMLSGGN